MSTTEKAVRPFYETVVEAISVASSRELEFLATQIKQTEILKNHDAIIVAWKKRREEMGWIIRIDFGVIDSILEQKEEAQKASSASSFQSDGKSRALWIIIQRMAARIAGPDADFFKLHEIGRRISQAATDAEFQSAIADL